MLQKSVFGLPNKILLQTFLHCGQVSITEQLLQQWYRWLFDILVAAYFPDWFEGLLFGLETISPVSYGHFVIGTLHWYNWRIFHWELCDISLLLLDDLLSLGASIELNLIDKWDAFGSQTTIEYLPPQLEVVIIFDITQQTFPLYLVSSSYLQLRMTVEGFQHLEVDLHD